MDRKFYLKIAIVSVAVVALASSCINKDYDIKTDEIDAGVQLAPNGLSIPIGFIDQKTLGQIIDKDDKLFQSNADGDLSIRYDSVIRHTIDAINVDPITFSDLTNLFHPVQVSPEGDGNQLPSSVTIPGETMDVPVTGSVPSFDMSNGTQIQGLNLTSTGAWPGGYGPGQQVPGGQTFGGTITSGPNAKIEIDVALPDAVKSVKTVLLKDANEPNSNKAKVSVALNLNGLAPLTDHITIKTFTVQLPEYYTVEPGTYGGATVTMNGTRGFTVSNYTLPAGTSSIEFYILSLNLEGKQTPGSNEIKDDAPFSYSIAYEITTRQGTIAQNAAAPSAQITGSPAFRDAEFTTNAIEFKTDPYTFTLDQSVGGFNNAVEQVTKVAFKSPNSFTITMDNLNLPDVFASALPVKIVFPSTFDLTKVGGSAESTYDNTTKTLTAPVTDFYGNGLTMAFNSIDFPGQTGVPVGGAIAIKGGITAGVDHTFGEKTLNWSDIPHEPVPDPIRVAIGQMNLTLDLDNSVFKLNAVTEEVEGNGTVNKQFDVPEMIKGIKEVAVEAVNSTRVEITLSLDITNPLVDEFYLDDFTIDLPDFIAIDTESMNLGAGQSFDAETNKYIDKSITVSGPSVQLVKLYVKGLRNIDIKDLVATLQGEFSYSATVRTPQGFQPSPGQGDMTITPRLDITDVRITSLEGMFDFDLAQYVGDKIDPISLKSIFDVIGSADQIPDLATPVIELEISNPVGINLLGNITIDPHDAQGVSMGDINIKRFRIDPATGQTARTTKLYITNDGASKAPEGWIGIDANLSDLVQQIPYSINIGVDGNVNPDASLINTIMLGHDYEFELGYGVDVPLAFGPEMNLSLEHTVDGLSDTFSQLADYQVKVSDIKLFTELTVSFPLKLEGVEVEMLDKEGNPIEGLKSVVSGVISGPAGGGAAQTSTMQIDLSLPDGGDFTKLGKVDVMKLKVPIKSADNSEGAENRLNSNDYVRGRIWIDLPNGISADLKNLLNDSGDDEGEQQ